jgi:hypothetical protein
LYILEPNRFILGITLERVALPLDVPFKRDLDDDPGP